MVHVAQDEEPVVQFLRDHQSVAGFQGDVVLHVLADKKLFKGQRLSFTRSTDQARLRDRCLVGESSGGGERIEHCRAGFEIEGSGPGYFADNRDSDLAKFLDDHRDLRVLDVDEIAVDESLRELFDRKSGRADDTDERQGDCPVGQDGYRPGKVCLAVNRHFDHVFGS